MPRQSRSSKSELATQLPVWVNESFEVLPGGEHSRGDRTRSPHYPGGKFNLTPWTKGIVPSYTFSIPGMGTTPTLRNMHPEMETHIEALQKSSHTETAERRGKFALKDISLAGAC